MRFIKNCVMNRKIVIFICLLLLVSCRRADKQKPYVSIIFPPDNSSHPPDTLVVKVKANDNRDVEFVELFLNDTIKINTKYSPDSQDVWFFDVDFTASSDSTYYTLKARAVDKSGNFNFSPEINILITYGNHSPLVPLLIFPPDGYIFNSNVCTLMFKSSDPDGDTVIYDIFLSQDSVPLLYISDYSDTVLIDTLEYSQTYFWKIKARDTRGGENESVVNHFRTSSPNNPPDVPSNPSPFLGDTLVALLPDFYWSCSDPDGDSLKYDFYLDTKQNFQNPVIFYSDLPDTHFIPSSSLLPGVFYFWKIKAKDGRGGETISPVWNFRTQKVYMSEVYSSGIFSRDVSVYGDYLYEAGGETRYYSLKIYNISNPSNPSLVKELLLNEIPWICRANSEFCVIVSGTYGNNVKIYKRVLPDSLEFLSSFTLRGWIGEVKILNNSLFLIDEKGLVRIELSQTPYIYDSIKTMYTTSDFDLWSGGNLYVLTGDAYSAGIEIYDFYLSFKDSKTLNINNVKNISFVESTLALTTYNSPADSLFLIDLSNMLPDSVIQRMPLQKGTQTLEYFSPFLIMSSDNELQMFVYQKKKVYTSSYPYVIDNVYGIENKSNYIYLSSFSNKGFCVLKWTE